MLVNICFVIAANTFNRFHSPPLSEVNCRWQKAPVDIEDDAMSVVK